MLGSSCNPCCDEECVCADTCVYCVTLNDEIGSYHSCSSPMFSGQPPSRTDPCRGFLTQPVWSTSCSGRRLLLGDMASGDIFDTDPIRPAPFQPLQQYTCYPGSNILPTNGVGFYYTRLATSSTSTGTSQYDFVSKSANLRAVMNIRCRPAYTVATNQPQLSVQVFYQLRIAETSSELLPGSVVSTKSRQTEWYLQGGAVLDLSSFPSCSGASSKCAASRGDFAVHKLDATLSLNGLSHSINDGVFTGFTPTDPNPYRACTVRLQTIGYPPTSTQQCSDFLTASDALFTPPVLSFSLFQDPVLYPCNPLP